MALLVLVLGGGIYLRVHGLTARPLWVDEAESSINALTILEHGVPVDQYLGLPIYENTLVERWPDSREYEFRDTSYSRGLAVYHGWLPLYAIAASFKAFGIRPDREPGGLKVRYGASERVRRTWVPRAPAVLFGLIGLIAAYFAGLTFGGTEAAWAALIAVAFAAPRIDIDQQARYYAATVALSTICCLTVWRACTRRSWRDITFCAISLILLFYTHLLAFMDEVLVLALLASLQVLWCRRPADFVKFATLGTAVAGLTIPWLIATGFFGHRSVLPRGWPLLEFPADALRYSFQRWQYAGLYAFSVLCILLIWMRRHRLPARLTVPILASTGPAAYLSLQMLVASGLFLLLMPAASLSWGRLSVSLTGPFFLLEATFLGAIARPALPRYSVPLASCLFVLFLTSAERLRPAYSATQNAYVWNDLNGAVEFLASQTFSKGTRFYSSPNDHLTFTYMTGLPVQSIAPVRKTFLDEYPGPIVVLDRTHGWVEPGDPLDWHSLQEAAKAAGDNLTPKQARRVARRCVSFWLRPELSTRAAHVLPEVGALPFYATEAVNRQATLASRREYQLVTAAKQDLPILRGFPLRGLGDWWRVFFYRFVDPVKRTGANANYAARMRNSDAVIIGGTTWVFFVSRRPVGDT